ncbi:MAG: WD40-repeat-containing domain protein [Benniella sp.]|nr:MAG: WD40-repeat-containing domain protein [Benniella sp.]
MAQLQQKQPASFLNGHVAPVLTLENQDWMLASGSEDKTCRIWDIRTNRVHKALTGFESSVTTTAFTPADPHTIYVGSGDKIYTFDLRMESLILNTTLSTKVYEGAEDEINQIQINHRATYLAACDDAGDVRVLDLKSHKWMRPLERKHENIAMAIRFVPKKELQAISGGMDKQIVAWDFYKRRATQSISTDNLQPDGVQPKQLFNPPFVHSIAVHPYGTRAAVGLGDGSVQFLHTPDDPPTAPTTSGEGDCTTIKSSTPLKKSKKQSASDRSEGWTIGARLVDAHSGPIATIEYAGFDPNWLITSSGNGSIAVWDDQEARYESMKRQQLVEQSLKKAQQVPSRQEHEQTQEQVAIPYGRPLRPLLEFKAAGVFERVNCISTSRCLMVGENNRDKLLFVAGTYPRIGDKKLQGRIALYQL